MTTLRLCTDAEGRRWARQEVIAGHYLRTAPDPRTRPYCYVVRLGNVASGCLWFGRPEATRCYTGALTFGSLADVRAKRAQYDRWEVLCLSRVWLSADVQPGGGRYRPGVVPGFTDRNGVFRSTLASAAIRQALGQIGADYLLEHPPCFVDEPYKIRAVLSYCDTRLHRGVIYPAAGFALARTNAAGIQTWWMPAVALPTRDEDRRIRALAASCPRSERIRQAREAAANA